MSRYTSNISAIFSFYDQEMGFKKQQAAEGIRRCETVEAALESILNNQVPEGNIQDVVASSEDEEAAKGTNSTSASSTNSSSKIEANTGKQQSKKQKQQKAPLPPIPQHHYEQAQRQILLNKQQDVVKMKWVFINFVFVKVAHDFLLCFKVRNHCMTYVNDFCLCSIVHLAYPHPI